MPRAGRGRGRGKGAAGAAGRQFEMTDVSFGPVSADGRKRVLAIATGGVISVYAEDDATGTTASPAGPGSGPVVVGGGGGGGGAVVGEPLGRAPAVQQVLRFEGAHKRAIHHICWHPGYGPPPTVAAARRSERDKNGGGGGGGGGKNPFSAAPAVGAATVGVPGVAARMKQQGVGGGGGGPGGGQFAAFEPAEGASTLFLSASQDGTVKPGTAPCRTAPTPWPPCRGFGRRRARRALREGLLPLGGSKTTPLAAAAEMEAAYRIFE